MAGKEARLLACVALVVLLLLVEVMIDSSTSSICTRNDISGLCSPTEFLLISCSLLQTTAPGGQAHAIGKQAHTRAHQTDLL
jgi:hypothetical protein